MLRRWPVSRLIRVMFRFSLHDFRIRTGPYTWLELARIDARLNVCVLWLRLPWGIDYRRAAWRTFVGTGCVRWNS